MPAPAPASCDVSVVMPCLNEVATLRTCITEARAALDRARLDGEIIVADNGSSDGSQALAEALGARVVPVAARGYGSALRGGFEAARGRYLVMGDSDASYDFSQLDRFVAKLREGYDLVMGNRFAGGIAPGAMPWKNRYLGNPALSGLGRLFFKTPVADFHCGLRACTKAAYQRMDLRTTGMEFASEMVIKAMLLRLRVAEVPTTLRPDGRGGRAPHLRPWRDGWRHLRFMLLYSPRWLFLYPGIALALLGVVVSAILIVAPRRIGGVEFDISTLLFAAVAAQLGFQAVGFAVCAKVYALRVGLRPPEPFFDRLFRSVTLETGLVAGAVLLGLGLATALGAVWHWREQGFGSLDPRQVMRWVIPAASCLSLGSQVILVSFFLSVLGLRIRGIDAAA